MLILNLGAGDNLISGATNVDCMAWSGIDEVVDLTVLPWKWSNNSVDKIYMIHTLEHFENPKAILSECHRILKVGGILEIIVPHSSSIPAVGCLGHYRTFSHGTLDAYLCREFYMFKTKMFETISQEIRWWSGRPYPGIPTWILRSINYVVNRMIKLSPVAYENLWWPLTGGAREVRYVGRKV